MSWGIWKTSTIAVGKKLTSVEATHVRLVADGGNPLSTVPCPLRLVEVDLETPELFAEAVVVVELETRERTSAKTSCIMRVKIFETFFELRAGGRVSFFPVNTASGAAESAICREGKAGLQTGEQASTKKVPYMYGTLNRRKIKFSQTVL